MVSKSGSGDLQSTQQRRTGRPTKLELELEAGRRERVVGGGSTGYLDSGYALAAHSPFSSAHTSRS